MVNNWLIAVATLLAIGISGCSTSSSSSSPGQEPTIVASEDGTVEVIVDGETLFALAGTGPIARTFAESVGGVGVKEFQRFNERQDPLSVRSVSNEDGVVRVEYASARRAASRSGPEPRRPACRSSI